GPPAPSPRPWSWGWWRRGRTCSGASWSRAAASPSSGWPPAAETPAGGDAAAVGPRLPLLRARAAGGGTRGAPAGPHQEQPDLPADPPPARRVVPLEDLPQRQGPRRRPRRHPGAGHRVHVRRPAAAGGARAAPAADDPAGP